MMNPHAFRMGLGDDPSINIQGTLDDLTPPPCMPTGSYGPLSPGQVWCATQTGVPPPPLPVENPIAQATMGGITIAGVTISPWAVLFGIGVGLLVIGSHSGRR